MTYSSPEIASVGLNEAATREQFGDVVTATYDLAGNGKSLILRTAGGIKVVRAPGSGPVVGVHMVGEDRWMGSSPGRCDTSRACAPDTERSPWRGYDGTRRNATARTLLTRAAADIQTGSTVKHDGRADLHRACFHMSDHHRQRDLDRPVLVLVAGQPDCILGACQRQNVADEITKVHFTREERGGKLESGLHAVRM